MVNKRGNTKKTKNQNRKTIAKTKNVNIKKIKNKIKCIEQSHKSNIINGVQETTVTKSIREKSTTKFDSSTTARVKFTLNEVLVPLPSAEECESTPSLPTTDMVAWNDFELKRPPLVTVVEKDREFVGQLQRVVEPAIRKWFASNNNKRNTKFSETAALLSRLMARRKNSFRHMGGFRCVCKINAALRRLLRVDFHRELERFESALPDDWYSANIEVPTGNCCEYVIARLLAVYHIHARIRSLCVVAAKYFTSLMHMNYFMDINVLLLAVIAKLYSFSGAIGNDCAALYDVLNRYKEHFPYNASNRVLPIEYVFPSQLERFSSNKQIESHSKKSAEDATMESLITTVDRQTIVAAKRPKHSKQRNDIGVMIERQTTVPKPEPIKFSLDQLQTVEQASAFIKSETLERQRSPQTCVTKNLQQHEWLGLQNLFQRKIAAQEDKKALAILQKYLSNKL